MAVLVSKNTKIMVQGITGTQASFHIQRAMKYGTQIVAGVVPNKNESSYLAFPCSEPYKRRKTKPVLRRRLCLCRQNMPKPLFWRLSTPD